MVTDKQVQLLRQKMAEGKTIEAAAAAADMSARSAHNWKTGLLPSQMKQQRHWRTRPDAFEGVWDTDVVPLLERDEAGVLEATTILDELVLRHGDRFSESHLRTLQRRVRDFRALHGSGKEVFFEQQHPPGREAAIDFTNCTSLGVTIAGELFVHLLFQFVLSFSKWRWVMIAFGETFEALVSGLQGALWELGGVPAVVRSDNLSAATHALPSGGRELNRRFAAVLQHYDIRSTRIEPGKSNQNGIVEKANDLLKSGVEQALIVRGSRDFTSVETYFEFLQGVRTELNRPTASRLIEERAALGPLPSCRLPEYTKYLAVVRKWSTIHFGKKTYSVPSRLIGSSVEVRQYPDIVEVYYRRKLTATMPRIRGEQPYRIDYAAVKAIAAPERPVIPEVRIPAPNPAAYNSLLAAGGDA
jgi:hypothetical protein